MDLIQVHAVDSKLNIVVGAHIYPASAPGSVDEVTNGLALCQNHHWLFDAHDIWVHPTTRVIRFSPNVIENAKENDTTRAFVNETFSVLADPTSSELRPDDKFFCQRYAYFPDQYKWLA